MEHGNLSNLYDFLFVRIAWNGQDVFLNTKGTKVFLVSFLFKDKNRSLETCRVWIKATVV
jgi:hypothetical protein